MKKSNYQQYLFVLVFILCFFCLFVSFYKQYCLHTSAICNLVQLLVEYSNYSNKHSIQRCVAYQGLGFIKGRCLFQCRYPKVQRLLEGGVYLRPGPYQRKYGKEFSNPLSIIKQVPFPVESRLSSLSSSEEIFGESTPFYQEAPKNPDTITN